MTEIPTDVRRLVSSSFRSAMELELLLLLRNRTPDALTSEELAGGVRVKQRVLERAMFDLMARGLLAATKALPIAYRYGPRTHELAQSVSRLAELYVADKSAIDGLILDGAHARQRRFPDV